MQSIFTIERRKDLRELFEIFYKDLDSVINTSAYGSCSMNKFLDRCIKYWPYRCGAIGISDYMAAVGVDIKSLQDDKEILLTMELLINLLHWAPKQNAMDDEPMKLNFSLGKFDVINEAERMLQNADYMLEQCCNMKVREENCRLFNKYHVTRKNAGIDAAIIVVPQLSDTLLSYFDIRNEDDIEYKKSTLTTIYNYMEPHRKEYKAQVCGSVSEEFFTCMNSFGIRHNTKSQIKMQSKKKKAVCDKMFFMAVYVLQTQSVNEYKNELKGMREVK